jgi:hypothetical protein
MSKYFGEHFVRLLYVSPITPQFGIRSSKKKGDIRIAG